MKRRFRLTSSTDFKRVRRFGKSYAHPLVVLVVMPNTTEQVHIGITAGRAVGGAVQRNRAKRVIRAGLQPLMDRISPGWDSVFIGRKPLVDASFSEVQQAIGILLNRAGLVKEIK